MEILLVRHGETKWNRELVFRGRRDIPLSERGREQAQLLGQRLAKMQIDAILSSPLARAVQTSQPAAEALKLDVEHSDALLDANFGKWSGLSRDEVKEKFPEQFEKWRENPLQMSFDGGDAVRDVRERSFQWLREIAKEDYKRIVVVTHRVILKLMLISILEASHDTFWQIRFDTCSISALNAGRRKFEVQFLNDTHHLELLAGDRLPDF